jgi:hypothetical protein
MVIRYSVALLALFELFVTSRTHQVFLIAQTLHWQKTLKSFVF